jgi:hypothetical protein
MKCYLINVNDIYRSKHYKVEHFRWRYVHKIDILGRPMLQSLVML